MLKQLWNFNFLDQVLGALFDDILCRFLYHVPGNALDQVAHILERRMHELHVRLIQGARGLECHENPSIFIKERLQRGIGNAFSLGILVNAQFFQARFNLLPHRHLYGLVMLPVELYLEGDYSKAEYNRRKADLQAQLDALRPPERPAIEAAGETLETLGEVWVEAPKRLRAEMLKTIFEEVRVDLSRRRLACVKPWPPFIPLFRMDGLSEKEGCFYVEEEGEEARSES